MWRDKGKFPRPGGTAWCSLQASFLWPWLTVLLPPGRMIKQLPLLLHNWPYLGFSVTVVSHSLSFHSPKEALTFPEGRLCRKLSLCLTDTHTHKTCATDLTLETSQCPIFLKLQSFPTQRGPVPIHSKMAHGTYWQRWRKNIVSFLFGSSFVGKFVPYLLEQWTGHRAGNESASLWLTWVWLVGWHRKSCFSVFITWALELIHF